MRTKNELHIATAAAKYAWHQEPQPMAPEQRKRQKKLSPHAQASLHLEQASCTISVPKGHLPAPTVGRLRHADGRV